MDWIKKNYDRAALIFLALVLIVSSALLISSFRGFQSRFEILQASVTHGTKLPALETAVLDQTREAIRKSVVWDGHPGSLFVSRKYLVKDGNLVDPLENGILHPPVPNQWFVDNKLDLLDENALDQDPDGDGFTNLDEYLGKTDPNDKKVHPAFITKLRLERFIQQPFRLKFAAYDEESFQINTLDVRQPSQFVKLGDPIAGTKFKVLKFEPKKIPNPKSEGMLDVSELTVENNETGAKVILILNQVADSPDSYAQFRYLLDGLEMRIKKDQTFGIKVEPGVEYKLIDIQESVAILKSLKTGEEIRVPKTEGIAR